MADRTLLYTIYIKFIKSAVTVVARKSISTLTLMSKLYGGLAVLSPAGLKEWLIYAICIQGISNLQNPLW